MKKIYSASISPMTEEGDIDDDSLRRLMEFNLSCGIDGFFFLGSMGEWPVLNERMKRRILETAVPAINGRAEILAGVSSSGLHGILDNMEKLSSLKVDSFVVQFPGGFASPSDPVDFFVKIADKSDRPLYLYYLPQVNNVFLTKDQFRTILRHPMVKGVKNSSGDMKVRKELLILKQEVEFLLFEGQEWNVDESLILGCDGALVGMASLGGRLFKDIAEAVDRTDMDAAFELQKVMIEIFDGVYGKSLESVWAGQKYALKILGIIESSRTLVPSQENVLTGTVRERISRCVRTYEKYLKS